MPCHSPRHRIEALIAAQRAPLDEIADGQGGREGVAELDDTEGGHDGDEAEKVGDGRSNDKGDGPVDRHDYGPENLAVLGGERGKVEEVHEDVVVEDLDADVAIQTGSNDSGDDGEHVAGRLPAVGGDALVGDLVDVSGCVVSDVKGLQTNRSM